MAERDKKTGQFLKGHKGYAKTKALGLSAMIRRQVDFEEVIATALGIMRTAPNLETRLKAINWLSDRGFGKAPALVQLQQTIDAAPTARRLQELSPAQLEALEAHASEMVKVLSNEPIDVPSSGDSEPE